MMPLQPQLIVLQQPDGLYPLVINFKIQDTNVELIGIRTPALSTSVVPHAVLAPLGVRTSALHTMVIPTPDLLLQFAVSVPSGV